MSQIRRIWITRFLNHHPELVLKFVSQIDCQRTYAGNPRTIQTHFCKLKKVIRDNGIKENGITNVGEKGFVMPVTSLVLCVTPDTLVYTFDQSHSSGIGGTNHRYNREGAAPSAATLPASARGATAVDTKRPPLAEQNHPRAVNILQSPNGSNID